VPVTRNTIDQSAFNQDLTLPYNLRLYDFHLAMQDVYDFFFVVNKLLEDKGLEPLDDMLRPAIMSGLLSDMLTASLAKHSRSLTSNQYFNGHPDLVVKGRYPNNAVKSGTDGVEIKSTRKSGGAVDMHGARPQWLCVFVYEVDISSEPATHRMPMTFVEVYLAQVNLDDFRRNERGVLGTRTATLHAIALERFRQSWVYRLVRGS
jgi:hypothetical protein